LHLPPDFFFSLSISKANSSANMLRLINDSAISSISWPLRSVEHSTIESPFLGVLDVLLHPSSVKGQLEAKSADILKKS